MFYDAAVDLTQRDVAVCESAIVFGQFMDDIDVRIGCESIGLEADEGNKKSIFSRLRELLAKIGHAIATFFKKMLATQCYSNEIAMVDKVFVPWIRFVNELPAIVNGGNNITTTAINNNLERVGLDNDSMKETLEKLDTDLSDARKARGKSDNIKAMSDQKSKIKALDDVRTKLDSILSRLSKNDMADDDRGDFSDNTRAVQQAIFTLSRVASSYQQYLSKCIYASKSQYKHDYKVGSNKGRNKADVYQTKKMNKFMDN